MSSCEYCTDLTILHHRLSISGLVQSVAQGCKGCFVLAQAIEHFPGAREVATHLQWVTDRSMHISLLGEKCIARSTIEIFTEHGK